MGEGEDEASCEQWLQKIKNCYYKYDDNILPSAAKHLGIKVE